MPRTMGSTSVSPLGDGGCSLPSKGYLPHGLRTPGGAFCDGVSPPSARPALQMLSPNAPAAQRGGALQRSQLDLELPPSPTPSMRCRRAPVPPVRQRLLPPTPPSQPMLAEAEPRGPAGRLADALRAAAATLQVEGELAAVAEAEAAEREAREAFERLRAALSGREVELRRLQARGRCAAAAIPNPDPWMPPNRRRRAVE